MKKLLIFDLDGTLLDSSPSLSNSINFMLKKLGLNTFDEDIIKTWIGNGASTLVKRALIGKKDIQKENIDEEVFNKAFDIFINHYANNLTFNTFLYDNVKEVLQTLYNSGYILTIATNKPYRFIEPILKYFEIDNLFTTYLGGDSVEFKKPNPQMLLKIIQKLKIDKEQAIMIGDSNNDLLAAKEANIDFLGVCWGYKQGVSFDECISDFRDIFKYLKG